MSGAITWGIGTGFDNAAKVAVSASKSTTLIEAGRIATHAAFQSGLSAAQGGDFLSAFASGAVGGIVGGQAAKLGNVGTIGSAMLLGGLTSEFAEKGSFWKGAAIAGIVAGANDVAHRIGENLEQNVGMAEKLRKEANKLVSLGFQKDAAALFSLIKNLPVGSSISGKDIVSALSSEFKRSNLSVLKELRKIINVTNNNGTVKIKSSARINLGVPEQYILVENGATIKISATPNRLTILSAKGIIGSKSLDPGFFNSANLISGSLSKTGATSLKLTKGQNFNLNLDEIFD